MNVLNIFTEAYKERVLQKTNQGAYARMTEFDEVAHGIVGKYGKIPNLLRIRADFENTLAQKSNWGCRMVLREFDYIISKNSADS